MNALASVNAEYRRLAQAAAVAARQAREFARAYRRKSQERHEVPSPGGLQRRRHRRIRRERDDAARRLMFGWRST